MRVSDIRRRPEEGPPDRYVLLLREVGGARTLSIWIGPAEGTSIAFYFQGEETARPMTHQFARALVSALHGRVREVRINRLAEQTFYAETLVEGPEGTVVVDSRPSDAIAIALLDDVPIAAAEEVLDAGQAHSVERDGPIATTYPDGPDRIVASAKEAQARALERFRGER